MSVLSLILDMQSLEFLLICVTQPDCQKRFWNCYSVSPVSVYRGVKPEHCSHVPVAAQSSVHQCIIIYMHYYIYVCPNCTCTLPSILLSVTMEDPVKEVADLMESTKEEGWEKSLSNKQVTFVVYREGDQLNFFRVVDRGDGTLTPLSESMRFRIFSYCLCLFFSFFFNWNNYIFRFVSIQISILCI